MFARPPLLPDHGVVTGVPTPTMNLWASGQRVRRQSTPVNSWTQPFCDKGQAGYITDTDTDLIYCQHRVYDPKAGRWLTRDPIGVDGGINSYEYCDENPVMKTDPSGLEPGRRIWFSILKWALTDDGYAPDWEYRAAKAQAGTTFRSWPGHFVDKQKIIIAPLLGDAFWWSGFGELTKPEKFLFPGAKDVSSRARWLSYKTTKLLRTNNPNPLLRALRKLVHGNADYVKTVFEDKAVNKLATKHVATFLWVEAGLAWWSTAETMREPLRSDLDDFVP